MWGAYIAGIYPRSDDFIKATRRSSDDITELFLNEKKKVIMLQVETGLSYITDPQCDWDDLLRPYSQLLGIKLDGLNRFYENNTFYKRPVVVDRIQGDGKILINALSLPLLPKDQPWKMDIPDPFTFADLCENRFYQDKRDLMFDFAYVLSKEVESLVKSGFRFIQINGPSVAMQRDEGLLREIGEAVNKVTKGLNVKVYMHLYFGDVSSIIDELLEFKVDGLGIDFISTPLSKLTSFNQAKGLACGCVNAQSTKIESSREIILFAENVLKTLKPREVFLCPNCDFEFIPYRFAKQKVLNIGLALKTLKW